MLPLEVVIALPIPFLLAQIVVLTYLLLPLLHLLPRPGPLVQRLISLIPHPRRSRNLPREFFNLPPRPDSPNGSLRSSLSLRVGAALGVRGKVLSMMLGQVCLSLTTGWVYLAAKPAGRAGGLLLALSVLPISTNIAVISLFSAMRKPPHLARHELPLLRSAIFGSGGVTHSTILPRILPCTAVLTATLTLIAVALPIAGPYLIAISIVLICATLGSAVVASRQRSHPTLGRIRLVSPSPSTEPYRPIGGVALSDEDIRAFKDSDSMISSPSRPPTPASAFSYSPSAHSAHSATPTSYKTARSQHITPKSSLTEFTTTPSTIQSWDFTHSPTPTLPTPESAITRSRPPSPALPNLSSPNYQVPRGSATTVGYSTMYSQTLSTPGSPIGSAGGSILAGYSPDPFQPMPRGFESLTSFPLTPEQLASRASLVERANGSSAAFTFVPTQTAEEGRESTWTLESYASHQLAYQTPKSQVRDSHRAPPPPPMPFDMPLPPTPTLARSETIWERNSDSRLGKDSTELLLGLDPEWDIVNLSGDEGALEGWASGGRGVGLLAILGILFSFSLAAPLLAIGLSEITQALYLVSLIIPTLVLLMSAHLLRTRELPNLTRPQNTVRKGSKTSTSTHQSLALKSESQLSLPATISPKLTPPVRQPTANVPLGEKWNSLLGHKPSISSFGYRAPTLSTSGHRRHTVYGSGALRASDLAAEDNMRKTLARRSVDIWLEAGHAKPPGNLFERATEMIKPTPALRIMQGPSERNGGQGVLERLRGGVVSMLPKRVSLQGGSDIAMTPRRSSRYGDADEEAPSSPITIHITSPSKYERRQSGLTREVSADPSFEETGSGDVDGIGEGEIQTATRARMSASPTYFFGRERAVSGVDHVELDWLQSAILPQLVPGIRVLSGVGVQSVDPADQFADAETPRINRHRRRSSVGGTPYKPDVPTDFDPSADPFTPRSRTDSRRELRHKHSFSLPLIDKASFSDLRSQMCQADLPRQHNWSIYADAPHVPGSIDFSAPPAHVMGEYDVGTGGIDLPAFPIDVSLIHYPATPALSTVDEANESGLSENMRHLARMALTAEEHFSHSPASLFPSPSSAFASHRPQLSTDSGLVGQDSFVSEDEAMAREMEQVLSMDTPTRAEFVISPTFSEATTVRNRTSWSRSGGFRPLSRASSAGSVWEGKLDKKISGSSLSSRRSAASAAHSDITDGDLDVDGGPSIGSGPPPPVPEIPAAMRRPPSQIFAHPFPVHNAAASIPLHINATPPPPAAGSVSAAPAPTLPLPFIPPRGPQQAFSTFLTCHSAETLLSESTDNATPSSMRHTWRVAEDEPELTAEMLEKAAIARRSIAADLDSPDISASAGSSSVGRVEKEVQVIESRSKALGESSPSSPEKAVKKGGLRPLKLLANRPPSVIGPRGKPAGIKPADGEGVAAAPATQVKAEKSNGARLPATPSRKKMSKGSRTNENELVAGMQTPGSKKKAGKLSKGSAGPAGLVPSGLRA